MQFWHDGVVTRLFEQTLLRWIFAGMKQLQSGRCRTVAAVQ